MKRGEGKKDGEKGKNFPEGTHGGSLLLGGLGLGSSLGGLLLWRCEGGGGG